MDGYIRAFKHNSCLHFCFHVEEKLSCTTNYKTKVCLLTEVWITEQRLTFLRSVWDAIRLLHFSQRIEGWQISDAIPMPRKNRNWKKSSRFKKDCDSILIVSRWRNRTVNTGRGSLGDNGKNWIQICLSSSANCKKLSVAN